MRASEELQALIQRLEHSSKPTKATLNAWAMELHRIKEQVISLEFKVKTAMPLLAAVKEMKKNQRSTSGQRARERSRRWENK